MRVLRSCRPSMNTCHPESRSSRRIPARITGSFAPLRMTLVLLALLVSPSAFAQQPQIALPRTSSPVTMDGDLSDEAWKNAAVIDKFYEYQRTDNGPSPVPTTAYVT